MNGAGMPQRKDYGDNGCLGTVLDISRRRIYAYRSIMVPSRNLAGRSTVSSVLETREENMYGDGSTYRNGESRVVTILAYFHCYCRDASHHAVVTVFGLGSAMHGANLLLRFHPRIEPTFK